jgi:hypothetical protein
VTARDEKNAPLLIHAHDASFRVFEGLEGAGDVVLLLLYLLEDTVVGGLVIGEDEMEGLKQHALSNDATRKTPRIF